MTNRGKVTVLLEQVRCGDDHALREVLVLLAGELKAIAKFHIGKEPSDHSWQSSDLFQELYVRVCTSESPPYAVNRSQFLAFAGRSMKNLLLDHGRHKLTQKRGGHLRRRQAESVFARLESVANAPFVDPQSRDTPYTPEELPALLADLAPQLVGISDVLEQLEQDCPQEATVLELIVFCGFKHTEVAEWLEVDVRTVYRKASEACSVLKQAFQRGEE